MKKSSIIVSLTIGIISSIVSGCNFAPGSYPYAEEYEIMADESSVIRAVQSFKMNNPQYIVPEQTLLKDGRSNEAGQDYWYHIYFYYKNENRIVKCWTRQIKKGETTFAFVGINEGLELGNWKMINKDFSNSENEAEKKKFEEQVLSKIKIELQK